MAKPPQPEPISATVIPGSNRSLLVGGIGCLAAAGLKKKGRNIASYRRGTGGKARSRCRSGGGHERRQARSDWPDASGAGRATPVASAFVRRTKKTPRG